MNKKNPQGIILVGTLPPIKGVSDYCIQQTEALAKKIPVAFYNFKSIYPEFLYKGGSTRENDPVFKRPEGKNVIIRDTLAWYNPFSWVACGLAKGKILHFHWWTYFLFPVFFTIALTAKITGKKVVCTIHNVVGHESGFFDVLLSKILFFVPTEFIVHTKKNKQQLETLFSIPSGKINIVPHGIYSLYFDSTITKETARKKLGIPMAKKVILVFGNLRKYKGAEDIIDAFKKTSNELSDLYLIIAGKPWDKDLQQYIKAELAGIEDKKLFLDYVPSSDVKYYFTAADLVVLPYREFAAQSGPGNIALAFEKPLLVSDVGGLPDLVLDKAAVFESGNTSDFASKLTDIFTNPGALKKLSSDSAKLKEKYSWETIAEKTLLVYAKLG